MNRLMGGGIETCIVASDGSISSRGMVTLLIWTVDCHTLIGDGVSIGQDAMAMLFLVVVKSMDCASSEVERSEI